MTERNSDYNRHGEKGDTLCAMSKEVYGDANKYNKILEANKPMLSDVNKIYSGQTLRIPDYINGKEL